jgi:hypothetical protein
MPPSPPVVPCAASTGPPVEADGPPPWVAPPEFPPAPLERPPPVDACVGTPVESGPHAPTSQPAKTMQGSLHARGTIPPEGHHPLAAHK